MMTKMKKYVFIQKSDNGEWRVSIVDDPVALYKSGGYDASRGDQLFQIGPEVKIEVKIDVVQEPTYRHPESFTLGPSEAQILGRKTDSGYNG
jgi:hypothetical protein